MLPQINNLTGGLPFDTNAGNKKASQQQQSKYGFLSDINKEFNPVPSKLSLEERFKLIRSIGTECIQDEELMERLKEPRFLRAYDGFEPSGRMHIAQGILRAINVNKLVDAGCVFVFWIADWFAMLNNKFKGDLEKIKLVGRYFIEVWRAAGMKMSNVQFLWASDEINKRSQEYWMMVMDIARKNTISRIKRCATIMGRNEGDDLSTAQLLYPCMQCADIFFLDVDICQLGIDQRKVNILAREYKTEGKKPIILSHDMILGLLEGQVKMSKSDPDSAIFVEDSEADITRKIKKAFCREKEVKDNPILDYCKSIIMQARKEFIIQRPEKFGGNLKYTTYQQLEKDFVEGKLHPSDLKPAVAKVINELIEPIRKHFETNEEAKNLLQTIRSFGKSVEDKEEKTEQSEEKKEEQVIKPEKKEKKESKEPKESTEAKKPKEKQPQQPKKVKKGKEGKQEEPAHQAPTQVTEKPKEQTASTAATATTDTTATTVATEQNPSVTEAPSDKQA